ncbi:putative phosphoglycerate mutase pmu1 [Rhodotorula kratochvilovae]
MESTGVALGRTRTFTPTNYTVVQDFFHQSFPNFNSTAFDPLTSSFGLLDRSTSRWRSFRRAIQRLNDEADKHTAYKVFFLARHGEGWHNVGERVHGTEEWDAYWSMVNGDGNITWGPDPLLTPLGISQAERAAAAWQKEAKAGAPLPQRLYSSPLSRAMSTLEITWRELLLKEEKVVPFVKENLREVTGVHTCDKRQTKSYIKKHYPSFAFERWSPDWRESDQQASFRIQQTLNHIFATDPSTYISITAHGGAISAFLRACGHPNPKLSVGTGSMVPVVVKAVDYPTETNELLAGGQSLAAPPRPTATAQAAQRRAAEL